MEIITRTLGPVQTNCYILIESGHAIIIDPGANMPDIASVLSQHNAQLDAILLTHAHFDHIEGLDFLVDKYDVPVYIHKNEMYALNDPVYNGSKSFMMPFSCHTKAQRIDPGKHEIGPFEFEMMHTPGHSEGSSIFIFGQHMFAGDTLFLGSIGRTDLPGGSLNKMMRSLERIKLLKENYTIYPGHGPLTSLDQEKQWNPYLR